MWGMEHFDGQILSFDAHLQCPLRYCLVFNNSVYTVDEILPPVDMFTLHIPLGSTNPQFCLSITPPTDETIPDPHQRRQGWHR